MHDRLAELGARLIVRALAAPQAWQPQAQDESFATYAHKVEKHEAALDWQRDAATLVRQVQAFNPFPGATTTAGADTLKVWGAQVGDGVLPVDALGGQIVAFPPAGIAVAAMNSIVVLTELQRAGGKRLDAQTFARGYGLALGQRLG